MPIWINTDLEATKMAHVQVELLLLLELTTEQWNKCRLEETSSSQIPPMECSGTRNLDGEWAIGEKNNSNKL